MKKFKGTKGKLNITDNGNSQLAIYGEDLVALAFIPKLHPEFEVYSKLFKSAPELLKALQDFLEDHKNDEVSMGTVGNAELVINKILE